MKGRKKEGILVYRRARRAKDKGFLLFARRCFMFSNYLG
jgi:hypothetical protein